MLSYKTSIILSGFVLAFFYICLSVYCFVQIVYVFRKQKVRSTGALFYPLVLVGCLLRTVWVVIGPLLDYGVICVFDQARVVINSIPSCLFFSAYLIVLFSWASFYHNSYESESPNSLEKIRNTFLGITIIMYTAIVTLYLIDFVIYPIQCTTPFVGSPLILTLTGLYFSFIYMSSGIAFAVYAILISRKMRTTSPGTQEKSEILKKIKLFTTFMVFVFLVRCGFVVWDAVAALPHYLVIEPIYYLILELIPLAIMIKILKMDSFKHGNSPGLHVRSYLLSHQDPLKYSTSKPKPKPKPQSQSQSQSPNPLSRSNSSAV